MTDSLTISSGQTDRRRWIALVVVCLAMLMNALDSSIQRGAAFDSAQPALLVGESHVGR